MFLNLCQQLSALAAWLAMHWQAMAKLFYLMETLTQCSKIPPPSLLGSHWQVATMSAPMLQIPHSLCGAPQANPCFATIPFSLYLNPDELAQ